LVMIAAAFSMIRGRKEVTIEPTNQPLNFKTDAVLCVQGLALGVVTGFVGAGGGFLIIPALVLLAKFPMKQAVGTSLFIIAVNSLLGFTGDLANQKIHWSFLIIFTAFSMGGIFLGIFLTRFITGAQLKKGFGWFVLVMGFIILTKQFLS